MKKPLGLIAFLLLLLAPTLADAAIKRSVVVRGAVGFACGTVNDGSVNVLIDASAIGDCDATGGGTTSAVCLCDSGTAVAIATAEAAFAADYVLVTKAGQQTWTATGAGNDATTTATDDVADVGNDIIETGVATAVRTAPAQTFTASTSTLFTTPKLSVSGAIERKVTDVTVADDAAGTKPAGVTPITTDFVTCTCNDATGCTMSVAEPTPTSGYGRSLTIVSAGTGNCEYADSAGVTEIGSAVVLEPTSVLTLVYANAAWHRLSTADNVP